MSKRKFRNRTFFVGLVLSISISAEWAWFTSTLALASPLTAYEEQLRYVERELPGEIHAHYSTILDQNFQSRRYDIEKIAAGLIQAHVSRRNQCRSVLEKWEQRFTNGGDLSDPSRIAAWMIEYGNDQRHLERTIGALGLIQRDYEDLLILREKACEDGGLTYALRELRPERLIPIPHLQFDPTQGLVSSFPIRAQIALTFNGASPVYDLSPSDRGADEFATAVSGLSAHYSAELASHYGLGGFESYLLERTFEAGAFLIRGLFEKDWSAEKQKLISRINEGFRSAVAQEQRKSGNLISERCRIAFAEFDGEGTSIGMSLASVSDMGSRLEASWKGLEESLQVFTRSGRELAAGYESSLQRTRTELSVLRENWQVKLRELGQRGLLRQRGIREHFATHVAGPVAALRSAGTESQVLNRYGYEMQLRDSIWSGLLAGDLRFVSHESHRPDPFWTTLKTEVQKEIRR